jgi:5'(3')-deoxyribonucleotidase
MNKEDHDLKSNKIIICDLDGTLADCSHRQHHVQPEAGNRKDWKAFFKTIEDDTVNQDLNEVLKVLHQFYDIYFVTARPNDYYGPTVRWLLESAEWQKDEYNIIMRRKGDFRADTIVKQEILDGIKADGHQILMVFDDRKSVVNMWRANNLFTCQVADHDF